MNHKDRCECTQSLSEMADVDENKHPEVGHFSKVTDINKLAILTRFNYLKTN